MFFWLAIACGGLLIFIFAGVITYWNDIVSLPGSAAAFLGALVGAGGGLLAIILGALFNAELNRRRDDRLRGHLEADRARDKAVLAMGLRAELLSLQDNASDRIRAIDKWRDDTGEVYVSQFASIDLPPNPVYANTTHRVGDLGAEASLAVVTAHGIAAHIRTNIAARRSADYNVKVADDLLTDTRGDLLMLLELALEAVNALDGFLGDPLHFPDPQAFVDDYDATEPAEPNSKISPE